MTAEKLQQLAMLANHLADTLMSAAICLDVVGTVPRGESADATGARNAQPSKQPVAVFVMLLGEAVVTPQQHDELELISAISAR